MVCLCRTIRGNIRSWDNAQSAMMTTSNQPSSASRPHPAIGFTAIYNGAPDELAKSQQALQRVLTHFRDLTYRSLEIGPTKITVWGRGNLEDCCHLLPDGSTLILIGSPTGRFTWDVVAEQLLHASRAKPFVLPWDGRVILLRIDSLGNTWTLWNDWVGSIPVFHGRRAQTRIASTLEPAVVEALDVSEQDIFLPGLLALLIWGHYFSDWTLFRNMKVVPPDCEACWEQDTFQTCPRDSVQPSEQRWNAGWDELLDEMYALSKNAISSALREHPLWVLPLSSGLDSRLIAGVAAELNVNVRAYTWGRPKTSDVIQSKGIAQVLGIPWKYLNPGDSYLVTYREHWADLFGSAMHFHGMYQIPFLEALTAEPTAPILSGFLGDCLAGYTTKFLCETYLGPYPFQLRPDGYLHWTIGEIRALMGQPVEEGLSELAAEVNRLRDGIPGALHQQLTLLNIWGRQRHFTYFQSMLSDYWRGVATPYLDRTYSRFSFSLPRPILDERQLQKAMLRRYFPKLATIPGTYGYEPALLTGSYLLKKRAANYLPAFLSKSIFPSVYRTKSNTDVECVKRNGKECFYPVFERLLPLSRWLNPDVIEKSYNRIVSKQDGMGVRKLQSIQTLAYRLSS